MGRSRETFHKKEVQKKKAKKRLEKEKKKLARKEGDTKSGLDDLIAYVDEFGRITDSPPEHERTTVKASEIEVSVPKSSDLPDEQTELTGFVTSFNESKGYGFIRDAETGNSVFFHVNQTLEEIREGNRVTYSLQKGQKGMEAANVKQLK